MKNLLPVVGYPALNSPNNLSTVHDRDLSSVFRRLMERDYALHTRRALASDLKAFITWYMQKNGETFSFGRVVQRDLADFRDDSRRAGLAIATINRRLVSCRLFFDAAIEERLIEHNPAKKVKQFAAQALAPRGLTPQETRRLLREVEIKGNLRDRIIVELLLATGLRCSELTNLTAADLVISERKGLLTVRHAKGNKTRSVPLNARIRALLKDYLDAYKPTDRLFIGQRGDLTPLAINKLLKVYGAKAGIDNLHPHRLRHSFAYAYIKANPSDLVGLSQLLGHRDTNITARYCLSRMEDLADRMENVAY